MADEQKGTEYVVLAAVTGDQGAAVADYVYEVARVRASNDLAAIKLAEKELDRSLGHDGAYAVPARSWRLRRPEDKTIQRRLWS